MQKVYKLYHASAATTNAAASITFARKGTIRAIAFAVLVTSGAGGYTNIVNEVSFANTSQITTNDTIGPIAACEAMAITSGTGVANQTVPCSIGVQAGDRIYVNATCGANISASRCNIFLYVDE